MDTGHSVIAMQYAQERIARAQAVRLATEARAARPRKRRRRRGFRLARRPVVTGAVRARR